MKVCTLLHSPKIMSILLNPVSARWQLSTWVDVIGLQRSISVVSFHCRFALSLTRCDQTSKGWAAVVITTGLSIASYIEMEVTARASAWLQWFHIKIAGSCCYINGRFVVDLSYWCNMKFGFDFPLGLWFSEPLSTDKIQHKIRHCPDYQC